MRVPRVELPHWEAEIGPDRPIRGPLLVGISGFVIPLLLAVYGVACILRGEAALVGNGGEPYFLYDFDAAVLGVGSLATAILLNCAGFWDHYRGSTPAGAKVKLCCLALMGCCAYVLSFRMLPGLWQ